MNKDIKVMVASHKNYEMPKDEMYLPVYVGAQSRKMKGFVSDDEGKDNISRKNPFFCELTGIYYGWKNVKADYLGLAHYRRHFKGRHSGKTPMDKVLSHEEASRLFDEADVILPKRRHYFIESVYSHYDHTHYGKDLDTTRAIIEELYPDYVKDFDHHMKERSGHICNMFIMKRNLFDQYCQFLFDIIFELEKRSDISSYSPFQARMYGRISEMLLDVWLDHNHIPYKEVAVDYIEPVKWSKKIGSFIKAKFFKEKYENSF